MPVAPRLRPVDEHHGATSDMCTPISPNTSHPSGREPLETTPHFPYGNCYHWSDGDCRMDVRVRSRPERFNDDVATTLPARARARLWEYIDEDYGRMERAQALRAKHGIESSIITRTHNRTGDNHSLKREDSPTPTSAASHSINETDTGFGSFGPEAGCVNALRVQEGDLMDDLIDAGLLGDYGDKYDMLPLVDLWLDLPKNLREEDIYMPSGLLAERDAVVRLITEGKRRQKEEAVVLEQHEKRQSWRRRVYRRVLKLRLAVARVRLPRFLRLPWNDSRQV
ncbi:hypothetical protein L227DRAFT_200246 [Lentinus tigrinus ALCF2SS1-6]|uniref:Uncharacterized protein n=1 Tax=Lentinus tigrinus ALCF2SS1-6 TaxID=1328759 RepID=A0A5C2S4P7_9APHY|nr:hypothetical protein L227DRAFT_200246 [Lentinus tigrinus ALCF2SS1-6]